MRFLPRHDEKSRIREEEKIYLSYFGKKQGEKRPFEAPKCRINWHNFVVLSYLPNEGRRIELYN